MLTLSLVGTGAKETLADITRAVTEEMSRGAHRTALSKTCSFTVKRCMLAPVWLSSHAGHDGEPFMLALLEFVRCSSHAEQAARLGLHWSTVGCSTAGLRALVRAGREVGAPCSRNRGPSIPPYVLAGQGAAVSCAAFAVE